MISFSYQRFFLRIAFLLCISASISYATSSPAASVIRPAPDISWQQGGHLEHLSSLRGKPVLLLITPNPDNKAFCRQLHELKDVYEHLATQKLLCFAAFTQEGGRIPSNIPFITVINGPAIASAYDVSKEFAVAVIGADGNLDCISTRVLPGQRISDLIDASYTTQERLRRP